MISSTLTMPINIQRPFLEEMKPLVMRRSGRKYLSVGTRRGQSRSCSPGAVHGPSKTPRPKRSRNQTAGEGYGQTSFHAPFNKSPSPTRVGHWPVSSGHRPFKYVVSPGYDLSHRNSASGSGKKAKYSRDPNRLYVSFADSSRTPNASAFLDDYPNYRPNSLPNTHKSSKRPLVISPIPCIFTNDEDDEEESEHVNLPETSENMETPFRKLLLELTENGERSGEAFSRKKYRVLGKGTFGQVVFGQLKDRRVAVKVTITPKCPHLGEVNAENLVHPNVVRTLGLYTFSTRSLVVMEYGGEKNLQQILDDPEELMPVNRRNSFALQIARGLHHCHERHVIHLDVKPFNVIVSSKHICKLCDFGSSVHLAENELCLCKSTDFWKTYAPGTVAYIAPEMLQGCFPSPKADVYSFGILLWQLMTRQRPYENEEPHSLIYKVVSTKLRPVFIGKPGRKSDANYIKICKYCWDENHLKRPSTETLVCLFTAWLKNSLQNA